MTALCSLRGSPRARAAALLALAAAAAACDDEAPAEPDVNVSRVRVVHALADGPAVDVRVGTDPEVVALAAALGFGTASPYATVRPGASRRVLVTAAGSQTALLDTTARFDFAREYSVFLAGQASGTPARTAFVISDTNSAPGRDSVRLRVVHAAASLGALDVFVTAPTAALPTAATTANVAFRGASAYIARPAAAYRVRAYPIGTRVTPTVDYTTPALVTPNVVTVLLADPAAAGSAGRASVVVDRVQ